METQENVVVVVQRQSAVEPGLADAADEGQSPFALHKHSTGISYCCCDFIILSVMQLSLRST